MWKGVEQKAHSSMYNLTIQFNLYSNLTCVGENQLVKLLLQKQAFKIDKWENVSICLYFLFIRLIAKIFTIILN